MLFSDALVTQDRALEVLKTGEGADVTESRQKVWGLSAVV